MFEPGKPKPENSGRQKGTPNKKTTALIELLDTLNVEPVRDLMALMPELNPKEKADVLRDLIGYIYPKRKAVEFEGEPPPVNLNLSIEELRELARAARDE